MGPRMSTHWSLRAQQIRHDRDERIANHRTRLSAELEGLRLDPSKVQAILNSSATGIVKMLNAGETTSYELVLIFAVRASTVGFENCWITEDNFDEALRVAKECDETRQRTRLSNRTIDQDSSEGLPELFGVPLSVKDTIDMKGFASTIGATARYDLKQPDDGAIMKAVRKSGLIPFVKTNVPQLAMVFESVNHMFGRSLNPWDSSRTVGGSSGGEAAMVAGRCSPIGLASDLGGSIRIPSQFCGAYALKPSSYRYPMKGHTFYEKSFNGNIHVPLTMGPIGRCSEDLALFVKVLCDENNYTKDSLDPYSQFLPFNVKMYKCLPTKMRIGYFDSLELLPATAASKRAVQMVKAELEKLGHELVRVTIPNENDIIGGFYEYIAAEGNMRGLREIANGETMLKEYNGIARVFALPNWVIKSLGVVLRKIKPRLGFLFSRSLSKNSYELFQLAYQHILHKQEFMKMWQSQNLDILIAPGFGCQALKHGYAENCTLTACYTFIWNFLETPVGAMPITRVTADEELYHLTYDDVINQHLTESARGSAGLPVGIQVVGLPYQDEKVLGVMRLIESRFPFYKENAFPK